VLPNSSLHKSNIKEECIMPNTSTGNKGPKTQNADREMDNDKRTGSKGTKGGSQGSHSNQDDKHSDANR
jgi:hypothetical protein